MKLSTLQYISDQQGDTTSVVVPIDVWQEIQKLLDIRIKLPQRNKTTLSQETDVKTESLVERDGLLFIQGKLENNIENIIQEVREERIATLFERVQM
jgi:hypothetical protein